MIKEGINKLFNSKDGKINLVLLVSVVLIFMLVVIFAEAFTATLSAPGNFTVNETANRNINFSFTPAWSLDGENGTYLNCSLYVNSTSPPVGWAGSKNVSTFAVGEDNSIVNNTLSYMNFTFTNDGNYTYATACWSNSNNTDGVTGVLTFSSNFSFLLDTQPPQLNFTTPGVSIYNTTSTGVTGITFQINDSGTGLNMLRSNSINLTILNSGGAVLAQYNYVNQSDATNLTCSAVSPQVTNALVTCNSSFNFASNGTFRLNISATDNATTLHINTNQVKYTVDQIPPVINNFTITRGQVWENINSSGQINGSLGSSDPSEIVIGNAFSPQGTKLTFFANITDNLTQPYDADVQFFNVTSGSWQTINTTSNGSIGGVRDRINLTTSANNSILNLTFTPPIAHNEFEGRNITFRILANDTLGNKNLNGSNQFGALRNITVMINDTTAPTILVTIGSESNPLNQSNTSDATPTVIWNVTENNALTNISVQIDSLTDPNCNGYRAFTSTVEANRNSSITLKGPEDEPGCASLRNGTHTVRVTALDTWGNYQLYIHSFQVQSGKPSLTFNGVTTSGGLGLAVKGAVNGTNITSQLGLNFSGSGGNVNIQNMTYVSSCNSTSTVVFVTSSTVNSSTVVYPFNESTCPTTSANRTLTVTVTDNVGNADTTVFGFAVDNVGPSITVNTPVQGASITNIGNISITAADSESSISSLGYYLDGADSIRNMTGINYLPTNANAIELTNGAGTQFIFNTTINFTPGTHTIKISLNDTLGNVRNSSVITFTQTGPIRPNELNSSLNTYLTTLTTYPSNATIKKKGSGGDYQEIGASNESDASGTFELILYLNSSSANDQLNITLSDINGSGANWDKINFSVFINETSVTNNIQNNWSNSIAYLVHFNGSIDSFLSNSNDYYGTALLPMNVSGGLEIWWFSNENDLSSRTNVSTVCSSVYGPTDTTPCYNFTSGGKTLLFVPHFSDIVVVNDTTAPTVSVTTPMGNQTVSMFVTNITVSLDTVTCYSSLNGTQSNVTMTKTGNKCIGQTERFKNLETANGYNFSFWAIDAMGNTNRYIWNFNVSDNTAPNNGIISSSPGTTTATVTITETNETVNATVNYGGTNTSLSSSATETDFNETQVVSITGLSASTAYYYNVTVCDYNGNCKTNASTFTFTTSAAAAAAASSTSSSSSGGGGGTAVPTSNVAASTGAGWDSLAAGSKGTLTSSSSQIAIVGINFNVINTLSNPLLNLESLVNNPLSTAAAGQVYQYLQLTHSNVADSDVSGIKITFRVPKAWLTSNNVAEGDVALYRYSDNAWNPLTTTITGSDSDYVTYEASSPGFSLYAVGNKEVAPEAPAETTPSEETTPETPAEETIPSDTGVAEPAPAAEAKSSNWTAIIAVIAVILVIALGYAIYRKKQQV